MHHKRMVVRVVRGKPIFAPRRIMAGDPIFRPVLRIEGIEVPKHSRGGVDTIRELAYVAHVEDRIVRGIPVSGLFQQTVCFCRRHKRGEVRSGTVDAVMVVHAVAMVAGSLRFVEILLPHPARTVVGEDHGCPFGNVDVF